MWTRPDAFIHTTAVIAPHLVFRKQVNGTTAIPWRAFVKGALLAGLFYLPWFVWAWWYYGSPIPHTIIAKSALTSHVRFVDILIIPWRTLRGDSLLMDIFLPSYWWHGGWPSLLWIFGYALSLVAAFAWLAPRLPAVARRLSLAVFLGMFYVCVIILFPWYSPPWTVLASLAIAFTVDHVFTRLKSGSRPAFAFALRALCLLVVAVQLAQLGAAAWQMRIQQRVIEDGVRRPVGEWLHARAKAGDTVLLEPLGYVGYFSQLNTYDFPGLSSPEVVAAIRGGARRYSDLIAQLKPTWLVLRPSEVAGDFATRPVLRDYRRVTEWNVMPQLDAIAYLPGRSWLEVDARFTIFHYEPPATLSTSQR
jgi:hypothetical protein